MLVLTKVPLPLKKKHIFCACGSGVVCYYLSICVPVPVCLCVWFPSCDSSPVDILGLYARAHGGREGVDIDELAHEAAASCIAEVYRLLEEGLGATGEWRGATEHRNANEWEG